MAKKFQPGCPCCDGTYPTEPCTDGQLICVRAYSLPGVCQYAEDNPGTPIDYESPTVALGGLPVTVYLTDSTRAELEVAGTCTTSVKGKCCVTAPPKLPNPTRAATVDGAGGGDSGGTMGIGTYQLTYAYKVADATPGLTATAPVSNEFQVGVPDWIAYPSLAIPKVNPGGGGLAGGLLDSGWYSVSFQVFDGTGGHTAPRTANGPISSYDSEFYVDAGNIPRVTFPRWWSKRPNAVEIRVYVARATAYPILDEDGNPTYDQFGNQLYSFTHGDYRQYATLNIGDTVVDISVYPESGGIAPTGNTIAKSIPRVAMPGPMPSGATDTLLWIRTMPGTSLSPYGTTREAEFNLPSSPSHVIAAPAINSTSWSQYKIRVGPPGGLEYDRCDYVDLRNIGTNCRKTIKDFAFCEIEITWTVLDFDTEEPIVGAKLETVFLDAGPSGCGETDTGRLNDNGDGTYTFVGASSIGASIGFLNCYQGEPGTGGLGVSVSHPDYFPDIVCGEFAPCGIPRAAYSREIRLFKRAAKGGDWVKRGGTERLTPSSWSVVSGPGGQNYPDCEVRQCLEFCGNHCASPELQDQGECYGQCQNDCGRPPDDRSRRGDIINKTLYVTFSGAPLLLGDYSGSEITLYWDATSSDGGSYGQPGDPPTPAPSQIRWLSGCLPASGAKGFMNHIFYTIFGGVYYWADVDNPIYYCSAQAAYVLGDTTHPADGDMEVGLWFENYWGADCTDPTLEFCPDVGDPLGFGWWTRYHRCIREGYGTACAPCSAIIDPDPHSTTAAGPKRVNAEHGRNYLSCFFDINGVHYGNCNGINYSCPPSWAMWNDSDYVIKVSINPYAPITCCKLGIIPELNYCTGLGSESCPNDCQKWGFVLSE